MSDTFVILLSTIFVNNFVMVQFLGLCPFMGASQKLSAAIGMAGATTFVLTLASAASYLTEHYLLVPLGLEYLRIITFIVLIAALVQFSEMVIRATQPLLPTSSQISNRMPQGNRSSPPTSEDELQNRLTCRTLPSRRSSHSKSLISNQERASAIST